MLNCQFKMRNIVIFTNQAAIKKFKKTYCCVLNVRNSCSLRAGRTNIDFQTD